MELWEYLSVLILNFFAAWGMISLVRDFRINKIRKALLKEIEEQAKEIPFKVVTVEEIEGKLHAYEQGTDLFLCRFTTFEELQYELERINPNIEWRMYPTDALFVRSYMNGFLND